MTVLLYSTYQRAKEIVGEVTSGTTIPVSELPEEVRQFDPDHPNGVLIDGWTYSDGIITLPAPAEGDVVAAISYGQYLFESEHMYQGLGGLDTSQDGLLIVDDEYSLYDLRIDVSGPNYTTPVVKWLDQEGEHDFPFYKDFVGVGQMLIVVIKVYLGNESFGNYRDLWFTISAVRGGIE